MMPAREPILSGSWRPGGTGTSGPLSRVPAYRAGTSQVPCRPPGGTVSFAHDVRNILSSVRGYAQLLLSTAGDEKMLEYLAIMEAESSRCCDLIERMLRPTGPMVTRHTSGSDTCCVVKSICELARGEAILRGVELVWEAEGRLPPAAIPRDDLERVLLNLVRNAVQATRRGGRVDVRARVCRLDGRRSGSSGRSDSPDGRGGTPGIEIEVTDTGRGIPEYALAMIFEPFFSTRDPSDGLGLGLAITSALVRRSGGSIDVESKDKAGTTFSVRLPGSLRPAPPVPD